MKQKSIRKAFLIVMLFSVAIISCTTHRFPARLLVKVEPVHQDEQADLHENKQKQFLPVASTDAPDAQKEKRKRENDTLIRNSSADRMDERVIDANIQRDTLPSKKAARKRRDYPLSAPLLGAFATASILSFGTIFSLGFIATFLSFALLFFLAFSWYNHITQSAIGTSSGTIHETNAEKIAFHRHLFFWLGVLVLTFACLVPFLQLPLVLLVYLGAFGILSIWYAWEKTRKGVSPNTSQNHQKEKENAKAINRLFFGFIGVFSFSILWSYLFLFVFAAAWFPFFWPGLLLSLLLMFLMFWRTQQLHKRLVNENPDYRGKSKIKFILLACFLLTAFLLSTKLLGIPL